MNKSINYAQLCENMRSFNEQNKVTAKGKSGAIKGVIVFTQDSFNKELTVEERSYLVTSSNKAWISGNGGYSIYGSALDGTDPFVRLDQLMKLECGGKDGWEVEYCYMLEEENEKLMDLLKAVKVLQYVFDELTEHSGEVAVNLVSGKEVIKVTIRGGKYEINVECENVRQMVKSVIDAVILKL